jgi:CheY-like chemotaxis protein
MPVIALGPPSANRPAIAARHPQVSVQSEVRTDERASDPPGVKVQVLRAPNFRRRKILLAEDDGPLRKVLARILDHAGYEVTAVEDGERAVSRAAAEQPDLVITDALMPKLHGFLVCKTVKGFKPAPKVIMLTAVYTKPGYKWEARDKYGADELITKPFNVPDLLLAVEKQLSRQAIGPEGI